MTEIVAYFIFFVKYPLGMERQLIRNAENIFPCLSLFGQQNVCHWQTAAVETPPKQLRPPSAKVNVYGIAYIAIFVFVVALLRQKRLKAADFWFTTRQRKLKML